MKVYAFSPWPSSSPFIYDRVGWPMLGVAMLVSLRLLSRAQRLSSFFGTGWRGLWPMPGYLKIVSLCQCPVVL